jgi:hypothetical protein
VKATVFGVVARLGTPVAIRSRSGQLVDAYAVDDYELELEGTDIDLDHEGESVGAVVYAEITPGDQLAAGLNGADREPVGCHDLRHSCAAFAFSLGMTPVEVARLLRHSDPAVTLTVYAGLDDATVTGLGAKLAAGLTSP